MSKRYTAQEMRSAASGFDVDPNDCVVCVGPSGGENHFVQHFRSSDISAMLRQAADAMEREKLMESALHDAITDVCNDCQYSEDNGFKCANADRDCYVIKWRSILANGSGEVSNV